MQKVFVKLQTCRIEEGGWQLFCDGEINDTPVRLLIDSGASVSLADAGFMKAMPGFSLQNVRHLPDARGINAHTMPLQFTLIDSFRLGDFSLNVQGIAMMDLSNVNDAYRRMNLRSVQGVIGCDILMQYRAAVFFNAAEAVMQLDLSHNQEP